MSTATTTTMRFEHTGEDWSGLKAAEAWLTANGYSYGRMQGPSPIGILKGDFDISKWRNMTPAEKRALHGFIRPESGMFRDSSAIVTLYQDKPNGTA
jgi:hypothetical protein